MAKNDVKFTWQTIIQYGLISGVAALYFCLVGMVETFHERDVIFETVSLGRSLLLIIVVGMGYFVALKTSDGNVGKAILGGAVVGLVSGLMTAVLVLVSEPLNMREMFVNASPALNEILTFADVPALEGISQSTGVLLLIAAFVVLHILAALIYILPPLARRFIFAGLSAVLLIGMLQDLLEVILSQVDGNLADLFEFFFLGAVASFIQPIIKFVTDLLIDNLFAKSGLSGTGAIIVFVVLGGLSTLWAWQGERVQTTVSNLPNTQRRAVNWVFLSLGIILLLLLPQLVGSYISQILVLVGLFILMGLGLNIEIGLAGLLDLGFVGFYAIGAYIVALATSTADGPAFTNFWIVIPFAVLVSALSGIFLGIPVLRMRGDYLAIVTLGLAEIIRILVLSNFLQPLLGGAQGILSIPKPEIPFVDFIVKDPGHFYYLILIGCVIIGYIAWKLQHARIGRSWMALREDEDVAEAMGINLVTTKLLAFGIGAAFAGLAGAIFAAQVGSIFPHSFQLLISVNVVSLVIIGGVGSIPGVIVGALVLVGLPELLREFAEFRLLIYGALLVVMMLVRPEGLWPSEVTRREMADDDDIAPAAAPAGK